MLCMHEHQDKEIWRKKCKHSDNEASHQILGMDRSEAQIILKVVSRHLMEEVRNRRN